jgi:hypothetical protein
VTFCLYVKRHEIELTFRTLYIILYYSTRDCGGFIRIIYQLMYLFVFVNLLPSLSNCRVKFDHGELTHYCRPVRTRFHLYSHLIFLLETHIFLFFLSFCLFFALVFFFLVRSVMVVFLSFHLSLNFSCLFSLAALGSLWSPSICVCVPQCFHSNFFHIAFDVARFGHLWPNIIFKIAKNLAKFFT